ncbi:MAG: glycosyltransferase family 2 protein [Dialister hominis]|uniref:glycosyltransferase family 2 protein n=1 Tax=Dialister hominis TaxID=2582419 RepID=UPI002EA07954|nr:glycosyltransferase family 2 protein [Dialister hominis]
MDYSTPKSSKKPVVSIIMPAYNSSATIEDSIESVLHQTFTDWELIIIDDCSEENIEEKVRSYSDKRIRYYRLAENHGVAHARNVAIKKARGRYLAFLDSDDLWLPAKLEHQIQFMERNHYAFTYTWYRQFKESAQKPGRLIKTKTWVSYEKLLHGNDIGCLTVMIDRNQILTVYMPEERREDYVAWLNILKQGFNAYSLPEDLARYRLSGKSVSGNKWKSFAWTWQVYRKSQRLSFMKSCENMLFYVFSGLLKHYG